MRYCTSYIVSFPYIRCVETADFVARELGATIKIEPGIEEVNTSHNPSFLTAEELHHKFPSIDTSYQPVVTGEEMSVEYSDGACARRSADAAKLITERRMSSRDRQPILFVGHGASCLGIAGQFGRGGCVGYTSLSTFVQAEVSGVWKCVTFGNVKHSSDRQTSLGSAW